MRKTGKGKYRQEFAGDYHFDYKDPVSLGRFISDGGKITPARISKLSIAQQKRVAAAVRKALVAFMAAAAMRKRAATKSALAGIAHAFASAQSTLQKSATIGEVTRQTA
jgi:ribosomal protein S18